MTDDSLLMRAASLILPVVVAGAGHVVVLKTDVLRPLAIPIDIGARWRGRPVFGQNKTWRGIVLMMALTSVATGLEAALARRLPAASGLGRVNRDRIDPWIAGALVGLSYSLAELPNSFLKRRLGIAPGGRAARHAHAQYLADQVDSVLGCLLAMRLVYRLALDELLTGFALGTMLHVGFDLLMYAIGVKRA